VREIARRIGRSPSTISRELRRDGQGLARPSRTFHHPPPTAPPPRPGAHRRLHQGVRAPVSGSL